MRILYVVNNYYAQGNGLSASARRTVEGLKKAGADVRVLSAANGDPDGPQPEYVLPDYHVPIFNGLINRQGYSFAASDVSVMKEAVKWADIVHLEEPFHIQHEVCNIAERLGKPCVGTYHMHPENLFSSVGMRKDPLINGTTLSYWRHSIYNRCVIIQCPSENARARLAGHGLKAELRVISNGISDDVTSDIPEKRRRNDGTYTVITTGRYSVEKDQITLLRAMKYSAYADRIRLILAGRGPKEKKLREYADKLVKKGVLSIPPVFGFYTLDELKQLYAESDLYIHCATVEVEGLSCMEAIQTGLVPIIADAGLSATAQFAKNSMSVFPERDAKALAERIDYWLSDDARRHAEEKKYVNAGAEYDIKYSISDLMEMYEDAIKTYDAQLA